MRTHRLPITRSRPSVRPVLGPRNCAYTDPICADRFPYTADTFNNPQKVWIFVLVSASHIFDDLLTAILAKAKFSIRPGTPHVLMRSLPGTYNPESTLSCLSHGVVGRHGHLVTFFIFLQFGLRVFFFGTVLLYCNLVIC